MVNKSKIKGTTFENEIADLLNNEIIGGKFKRNAGSGAIGTLSHEPLLVGDVRGEIPTINVRFKIECKARSGGKQITVEKEWFDKVEQEAKQSYSTPLVALKLIGARTGVRKMIAMDVNVFIELMNKWIEDKTELDELLFERNK